MTYKHYLQNSVQWCLRRHRGTFWQETLCATVGGRDDFVKRGEIKHFPTYLWRDLGPAEENIGNRNTLQFFPWGTKPAVSQIIKNLSWCVSTDMRYIRSQVQYSRLLTVHICICLFVQKLCHQTSQMTNDLFSNFPLIESSHEGGATNTALRNEKTQPYFEILEAFQNVTVGPDWVSQLKEWP